MRTKVLFVFGGIPHYVIKILNRIHEKLDVSVVVPEGSFRTLGNGVYQTDQGIQFQVNRLPEVKTWYGKPGFKDLRKTVSEVAPEVLVLGWPYYLMLLLNPAFLFFLRRKKIKLVVREIPFTIPAWNESFAAFSKTAVEAQKKDPLFTSRIAFYAHKLVWKILYKWVFHSAMCYTEDGKRILGSYGMDKEKVRTVYNSPDTHDINAALEALRAENLQRKKNRILHVGRLVFWKRVDLLIRAIHNLKNDFSDIELVVVGNGEEEQNLKALVAELQLQLMVKFAGAVYEEKDLCRHFQTSDVYVLAGMGGLSINEAMANGLPVICSVCDGTEKHLVFHGENGLFFEHDNLESLTESIREILNNDDLKNQMGRKSKEIIEKQVNIDVVIDRMTQALQQTAAGN